MRYPTPSQTSLVGEGVQWDREERKKERRKEEKKRRKEKGRKGRRCLRFMMSA